MNAIASIKLAAPSGKDYNVDIVPAEYAECPLNEEFGDELGTIHSNFDAYLISFERAHNRMGGFASHDFKTPDKATEWAKENGYKVLPIYKYEHGMVAFSTKSFIGRAHHADWDSGQIGVVFYKTEGDGGIHDISIIEDLLEEYSDWVNGSVYEVVIREQESNALTAYICPSFSCAIEGDYWRHFYEQAVDGGLVIEDEDITEEDIEAILNAMEYAAEH